MSEETQTTLNRLLIHTILWQQRAHGENIMVDIN